MGDMYIYIYMINIEGKERKEKIPLHHSLKSSTPGLFQGSLRRLRGTGTELHSRVPVEAATGGGGWGALTTHVATRRWRRTTRPGPSPVMLEVQKWNGHVGHAEALLGETECDKQRFETGKILKG